MIPLPTNRRILTWFCVYQNDGDDTKNCEKLMHGAFAWTIFCINLIGFVSSAAYVVKFMSVDFDGSLFALLQIFAEINMIYNNAIIFMVRHKIAGILKAILAIYEECNVSFGDIGKLIDLLDIQTISTISTISVQKTPEYKCLVKANNKSEWISYVFFCYVFLGNAVLIIGMATISVCVHLLFDVDITSLYHTFKTV